MAGTEWYDARGGNMEKWVRRIYRGTVWFSLALGMLAMMLWVRSYFAMDAWNTRVSSVTVFGHFWNERTILTTNGRVWYGWQHNGGYATLIHEANRTDFVGFHSYPVQGQPFEFWGMRGREFAGFQYATFRDMTGYVPQYAFSVPLWAILAAAAILPGIWLWGKRRRYSRGMCAGCGYDLRASPERCPECGRPV